MICKALEVRIIGADSETLGKNWPKTNNNKSLPYATLEPFREGQRKFSKIDSEFVLGLSLWLA